VLEEFYLIPKNLHFIPHLLMSLVLQSSRTMDFYFLYLGVQLMLSRRQAMPRQERKYPRLGEQIDQLVDSLVATKRWETAGAMSHICQYTNYSPDTVYRWRQGKICPSSDTL
jgi:hypothetical protein